MKTNILLIYLFILSFSALSQPLVINWQQCYGGSQNDGAKSLIKDGNNFIISGWTFSNDGQIPFFHGQNDYWVLKVDSLGEIIWSKTYGGGLYDDLNHAINASDGGYVLSGDTESNDGDVTGNHGDFDYWIVKIDTSGTIQWKKCLGGTIRDDACQIAGMIDGGYLCVGESNSSDGMVTGNHQSWDGWVVKLDSQGNVKWEKSLGSSDIDNIQAILPTSDKGALLGGWVGFNDGDVQCNFHGGINDAWLIKIDSVGNIEWQQCYGGSSGEGINIIVAAQPSGYLLLGGTSSNDGDVSGNHGGTDFWVIKVDSIGNFEWQKCYGGTGEDEAFLIKLVSDGNYIVGGATNSYDGDVYGNHSANAANSDGWLIKISPLGDLIWQRCFGGLFSEELTDLVELDNGSMMLVGSESSIDTSFDVKCNHHGTVINYDAWLLYVTDSTMVGISDTKRKTNHLSISPNPAKNAITVALPKQLMGSSTKQKNQAVIYQWQSTLLEVYSMDGRKLFAKEIPQSQSQMEIDVSQWQRGIYLFRLSYNDTTVGSSKVILN